MNSRNKGGVSADLRKRSRFSSRKLAVASSIFLAFLFHNYAKIMVHLSDSSVSSRDERTVFGTSLLGFRGQESSTTARRSSASEESSSRVWKRIVSETNTTSASRIGIHVLRPGNTVTKLIVLGERHSGTTFFTKHLKDCFPTVAVTDTFINYKHWFQHTPEYLGRLVRESDSKEGNDSGMASLPPSWKDIVQSTSGDTKGGSSNQYFRDAMVIVLVRNPYDWAEAMRRKPWHWPNHLSLFPLSPQNSSLHIKPQLKGGSSGAGAGGVSVQISYVGHKLLEWKDFVTKPLLLGKDYHPAAHTHTNPRVCQKGYAFRTISPCRRTLNYVPSELQRIPPAFLRQLPFDTHDPQYEHQPTNGEPFGDLLKLRSAKIQNFLSIPEEWELSGVGFVPFQRLLGNNSIDSLVKEIGSALGGGIQSTCPSLSPFPKAPYNISEDFRDWISRTAQWDLEALIGYRPS